MFAGFGVRTMVRSALIATFALLLAACNSTAGISPTATSSPAAPDGTPSAEPMGSSSPTPIAQSTDSSCSSTSWTLSRRTSSGGTASPPVRRGHAVQPVPEHVTGRPLRGDAVRRFGDKFGTAVYDLVTNTTDELLVPENSMDWVPDRSIRRPVACCGSGGRHRPYQGRLLHFGRKRVRHAGSRTSGGERWWRSSGLVR